MYFGLRIETGNGSERIKLDFTGVPFHGYWYNDSKKIQISMDVPQFSRCLR